MARGVRAPGRAPADRSAVLQRLMRPSFDSRNLVNRLAASRTSPALAAACWRYAIVDDREPLLERLRRGHLFDIANDASASADPDSLVAVMIGPLADLSAACDALMARIVRDLPAGYPTDGTAAAAGPVCRQSRTRYMRTILDQGAFADPALAQTPYPFAQRPRSHHGEIQASCLKAFVRDPENSLIDRRAILTQAISGAHHAGVRIAARGIAHHVYDDAATIMAIHDQSYANALKWGE